MTLMMALTPILAAVCLILVFNQSALRTGVIGTVIASTIALSSEAFMLAPGAVFDALVQGLLNTAGLSYVLLGGVFLYQIMHFGNALDRISMSIGRLIPHPAHQILVIVFGVSVFFESTTGFGVGIIVTAPLLIALGLTPLRAAIIALTGQCAITFGALAVGTVLGAELSGVSAERIGTLSALLSIPYVFICGVGALWYADRLRPVVARLALTLFYAITLSMSLYVASLWVGVDVAGPVAGLVVIGVGILLARIVSPEVREDVDRGVDKGVANEQPIEGPEAIAQPRITACLIPMFFLLTSLLLTRLIPALKDLLWPFGRIELSSYSFDFSPAYHPGGYLLLAGVAGIAALPRARRNLSLILSRGLRQWMMASLAILGFLCLGQMMLDAGMSNHVAGALVGVANNAYGALAPVIGGLGGFMTASNAASNAMFMGLQMSVADQLGLSRDWVSAAQNAAGSNMTMASPGRLVFAASAAGIAGGAGEAALMRRILPTALAGLLSLIVMTFLIIGPSSITESITD